MITNQTFGPEAAGGTDHRVAPGCGALWFCMLYSSVGISTNYILQMIRVFVDDTLK